MPALQLTFETRTPEELEAACFAAGALAVTFLDAADARLPGGGFAIAGGGSAIAGGGSLIAGGGSLILEPALGTTPMWPQVRVVALFEAGTDPATVRRAIEAALGDALAGTLGAMNAEELADRAWEREWLKDFRPMRFGTHLWVCPQGQDPPQHDAVIVRLDPGLAFGTGTHETTAMCLSWLDAARLRDLDVADYGCGSGILAISALLLGARSASAIDLDPQALLATRENARRNRVEDSLDVLSVSDPRPLVDVLLANILAQPLIDLAPTLASMVRPRGVAVLSGILASQAEPVASAYAPWFDMRPFATRNDWVCLEGVRR